MKKKQEEEETKKEYDHALLDRGGLPLLEGEDLLYESINITAAGAVDREFVL